MAAKIIDGKAIAAEVNEETRRRVEALRAAGRIPGLAVVLVGDDPASQVYVNAKAKKCAELGIHSDKRVLPADATMEQVLELIGELNRDPRIDGILVQSPPPPQIDEEKVIAAIDPAKDVDCFSERNVGKLLIGKEDGFRPCTPWGVMLLLEKSGIDPAGKHAVVIGRSNIVGKPMAALLMQKAKGANATVTVVHSGTPDIARFTRDADILIAAIGKPVKGMILSLTRQVIFLIPLTWVVFALPNMQDIGTYFSRLFPLHHLQNSHRRICLQYQINIPYLYLLNQPLQYL